jgi:hypothetical protein
LYLLNLNEHLVKIQMLPRLCITSNSKMYQANVTLVTLCNNAQY